MCVYESPTLDGKKIFVPVVCKDRSYLLGYLNACQDCHEMSLMLGLYPIDEASSPYTNALALGLSSMRYNDITEDDISDELITAEMKERDLADLIEELDDMVENPEQHTSRDGVLIVDCKCGLGFYAFKKYEDIPEETFKCVECGRTLIQYTGIL